jgi:hypothetical protein
MLPRSAGRRPRYVPRDLESTPTATSQKFGRRAPRLLSSRRRGRLSPPRCCELPRPAPFGVLPRSSGSILADFGEPHSSFAVPVSPPDAASTPHSAVMSTWPGSTVSSQHCMTTAGYEGAHRRHVARAASVALEVAVQEPTVGVIPGTRGRLQQDRGGCAERGQAGARGGASCGRGHHHIGAHEGRAAAGADPAAAAMHCWLRCGATQGRSASSHYRIVLLARYL